MEYGAIDLHSKESEIRIVTAEGEVVVHRRIATRRDLLSTMFGARPRLRILLESGTERLLWRIGLNRMLERGGVIEPVERS